MKKHPRIKAVRLDDHVTEHEEMCGFVPANHRKWVCVLGPHSGDGHYFRKQAGV